MFSSESTPQTNIPISKLAMTYCLIALAIEDRDLALEVREFVMAVNSYSGLRYPQLREFL